MQEVNLIKLFTDKLNQLNIPYCITGSVATIIYGQPRLTHDIDIVVNLQISLISRLFDLFPKEEFYLPPEDVLITEIRRETRGHCNIFHLETSFKADFYFVNNDDFLLWAIENARNIIYESSILRVAPPEYVIIKKLEFYKEGKSQKHLIDIKSILDYSSDIIDFNFLKNLITKYGLSNQWNELEKENF